MVNEADLKSLLASYRNAVEDQTRMKYALVAFPELEPQVSVPLMARQESRVQAAEIQLMSIIRKVQQ
jgi:hypothetical protein